MQAQVKIVECMPLEVLGDDALAVARVAGHHQLRYALENDRRAVDGTEHDAGIVARGVAYDRRDGVGELAGLPAELGISPAASSGELWNADAFNDLVGRACGLVDA